MGLFLPIQVFLRYLQNVRSGIIHLEHPASSKHISLGLFVHEMKYGEYNSCILDEGAVLFIVLLRTKLLRPCIKDGLLAPTTDQRMIYPRWLNIFGKDRAWMPCRLAHLVDEHKVPSSFHTNMWCIFVII